MAETVWPERAAIGYERHVAAAMHVASIFFPYVAPAIAYFVFRGRSRFVAVHALQAFFEALILNIVLIIGLAISLAFTIVKIVELIQTQGQSFSWDMVWQALIKAVATYVILALVSLWYTIASVVQALQALDGRWRSTLLSGRIAARIGGVKKSLAE